MANRRLAISSLLSSDSSTPTFFGPQPSPAPVPVLEPEPASVPLQRHDSPPIHFSLPATLTRRTPSPTTLDDAPPMKRHRSDPEPHSYHHKRPLSNQHSPTEQSPGSGSRAQKVSYNNPGFYSPRPLSSGSSPRSPGVMHKPRPAPHSVSTGNIHDGLVPLSLATFAETTNTEQRWAESRTPSVSASGSGTHSPVTARPDYQHPRTPILSSPPPAHASAVAALSAGAKVVEDVRASLIEERSASRARRSSADLPAAASSSMHHDETRALPRLAAKSPLPDYTPARHAGPTIGYPSSSERERRSPPRSTSSSLSPTAAVPPAHRKSGSFDAARSGPPMQLKTDSPDAHDWLVDHYAPAPASASHRVHRGPGMHYVEPGASDRDHVQPGHNHDPEPVQAVAPSKPTTASPSPTVDEELLSLLDGPDSSSKLRREEHPDRSENATGPLADHVEQQPTQHLRSLISQDVRASGQSSIPMAGPSQAPDIATDGDLTKAKAKRSRPSGGKKKADGTTAPRQRKKATGGAAARRSASAMPGSSRMSSPSVANGSTPGVGFDDDVDMDVDVERPSAVREHLEQEKSPSKREKMKRSNDDNKLYCICKMPYEENRIMIACDKCDEWYHTACVDLPEPDVDLIDQFVCPVCQSVNPSLQTSYKMRCLRGTITLRPSSRPCSKAARIPLSKYCSDECGLAHVRERLEEYQSKGGKPEPVWDAVKDSRKVEGLTKAEEATKPAKLFAAEYADAMAVDTKPLVNGHAKINGVNGYHLVNGHGASQTETQLETLRDMLDRIARERDALLRALDFVRARERLIEISSGRSERMGHCGWDERLLFSDGEWQAWIGRAQDGGGGAWLLSGGEDSDDTPGESGWWCTGKKKCDRHNGWQKLRLAEVEMEKALKIQLLDTLTSREREIRRCIEDLEPPVLLANAFSQNGRLKLNGKASRSGGPRKR